MIRRLPSMPILVVLHSVFLATACADVPARTAAAAAPAATAGSAPSAGAAMAHGDHEPHHGGTVYMYKEVHYEVVLSPEGRHRLYFTDAVREDLPASVATRVSLNVMRPAFTPEAVTGTIDEHGESWRLDGAPVTADGTSVRVTFDLNNETYWIDVPFLSSQVETGEKAAP